MPWRRTSCRQSPQRCQRSKIGGAVGSGDARRVAGIRSRCRSASNCCWWSSGCGCTRRRRCGGFLFGISHPTVLRTIARVLPILEQAGRDTMRLPGHGQRGRRSRRNLPDLLAAIPELTVIVDTFEQRVQRPRDQEEADRHYSGKKKQHTLKSQVAIDAESGQVVDVPDSVCGPTSDLTVLKASGLLDRLDPDVGVLGDLAYVGMAPLHPAGLGFTPRRKPREQPRPPEDVVYNTAFAAARIGVEHAIGRLRRYQALTQQDRQHRRVTPLASGRSPALSTDNSTTDLERPHHP